MKNGQRAKLDSFQRVQAFNTTYATALTAIPDYAALQQDFDDKVTAITTTAAQQEEGNGLTPEFIESIKTNMAETVIQFAARGSVKAQLAGNEELANQLDKPVSFVGRAQKNISAQRARQLRDLINNNLTVLTTIAPGDIATIDAAITTYTDVMNKPVVNIQQRKSKGTDAMPPLFKQASAVQNNMFRLVKSYYAKTDAAMVSQMKLAVRIIDTGIRHTQVNIMALAAEDAAPLPGVTILDNSNQKTYTGDAAGLVNIKKHKSGHTTFTVSAAGRQSATAGIAIEQGADNKLTVKLVRA